MEAEAPTVRVGTTPSGLMASPPNVFYRPDALPAAQPTASKHWRYTSSDRLTWAIKAWWAGVSGDKSGYVTDNKISLYGDNISHWRISKKLLSKTNLTNFQLKYWTQPSQFHSKVKHFHLPRYILSKDTQKCQSRWHRGLMQKCTDWATVPASLLAGHALGRIQSQPGCMVFM